MSSEDRNESDENDLFSGRGAPALMSTKEPAIRMLKERYSESFALTQGHRNAQVHLFLIKLGMWALVWTFTPRDLEKRLDEKEKNFGIAETLPIIEAAISGKDPAMQEKLDKAISRSLERIESKLSEIKGQRPNSHNS
jgi:hypothetical protein